MASAEPVVTSVTASARCSLSTKRAANGAAIAQNTECAQATTRRAASSTAKPGATPASSWPAPNTASTAKNSGLKATRVASTMSGTDKSMTAQA